MEDEAGKEKLGNQATTRTREGTKTGSSCNSQTLSVRSEETQALDTDYSL